MKKKFENVVKTLNLLIETNIDRIKGYETAAGNAEDREIKKLCNDNAAQSRTFKDELEHLVTEHGGEPQKSSSPAGVVYRTWMEIKHATTDNNKISVLSSCDLGEDAAIKNYEEARKDAAGFPEYVMAAVNSQHTAIKKAHEKVKSMRDALVEH